MCTDQWKQRVRIDQSLMSFKDIQRYMDQRKHRVTIDQSLMTFKDIQQYMDQWKHLESTNHGWSKKRAQTNEKSERVRIDQWRMTSKDVHRPMKRRSEWESTNHWWSQAQNHGTNCIQIPATRTRALVKKQPTDVCWYYILRTVVKYKTNKCQF